MKKAMWLACVFLCATGVFASETPTHLVSDGRKRNEDAFERTLEQTGWIKEKPAAEPKKDAQGVREHTRPETQTKSS